MPGLSFVPRKIFLTKGVGRHKEKLASFEAEPTSVLLLRCSGKAW